MGMLSRFRRKRRYAALSDEERIGRYVYLLNTLPASVIEKAHASAFSDVPAERRREMFEQLRPSSPTRSRTQHPTTRPCWRDSSAARRSGGPSAPSAPARRKQAMRATRSIRARC
nr:hypothetical protein GCM10025699_24980 [Microbacterium flavescens]